MNFPGLSKLSALGARMSAMKQAREGATSDMLLQAQQHSQTGPNYMDPTLAGLDPDAPVQGAQGAGSNQQPTQTQGNPMQAQPMQAPAAPGQPKLPSPPAMSSLRDVKPRSMGSQMQGMDRKLRAAF